MVDNGFVETFVDTYLRKKINDTLSKYEELISPNKVKCSAVYKVDGRKMYNIDVNISISPSNIKDDTCEKIDIIIAEKGAAIGFAGRRVVEQTIKQSLPDHFQTAEFLQEKGLVDIVVSRQKLKQTISELVELHEGSDA